MKRVLKYLFCLIVMVCFISVCYAETKDNKPPVLNSYSFDKTEYMPGETATITIDANDEVSGLGSVSFIFLNVKNNWGDANASFTFLLQPYDAKNGKNAYKMKVPVGVKSGTYNLIMSQVLDQANNDVWYCTAEIEDSVCEKKLKSFSVKIVENTNYNYPEIESFSIDKKTINYGEEVSFKVVVKKPETISSIRLYYDKLNYSINFQREGNSNVFVAKERIKATGTLQFRELQVTNNDDLLTDYTYKKDNYTSDYNLIKNIFNDGEYDIKVSSEVDTTFPTLKSVKLSSNNLKIPSVLKVTLDAYDNIPDNIQQVYITINKPESMTSNKTAIETECFGEYHKYVCTLDINQYTDPGDYVIVSIQITDYSGNISWYSINSKEYDVPVDLGGTRGIYRKLDTYKIKLKKDIDSDIITSSSSTDLYEKIENAKNGDKISIDSTKNSKIESKVFELIKGTSKQIYIESNGIIWIFNGEHINNPKDIDVKVNISLLENYNDTDDNISKHVDKALVINFKNNGQLPGKVKIRMKADYTFRYYIGVSGLNVYYDNKDDFDTISSDMSMTSDGYYEFYIDHNSTYILTSEKIKKEYIKKDLTKELGNEKLNNEIKEELKKEDNEDKVENNNEEVTNVDDKSDKEEKENNKKSSVLKIVIISIICVVVIAGLVIGFIILKKKKALKKD